VKWICKVTNLDEEEVWRLVKEAFKEWAERSKYKWKIDYSYELLIENATQRAGDRSD